MIAARGGAALVLVAVLLAPAVVPAEPVEPPPEAVEGADFAVEAADSVEDASVEWTVGAAGSRGASPRRMRRVRFQADSLAGTVNEGESDPLAGGSVSGRSRIGELAAGSQAPRWGRGLVVGAPADPWSQEAQDRGRSAPFRGRSGEGVWFRRDGGSAWEAFCARFAKRPLAGVAHRRGPWSAGVLAGGRGAGRLQASLALAAAAGEEMELAVDRGGLWRAEALARRRAGPAGWTLRARAGLPAFRSLAEPRRSGPAQAAAIAADFGSGAWRGAATLSAWRFAPGATGARAGAELAWRGGPAGDLRGGVEEQHGVRRLDVSSRGRGLRQGGWLEWHHAAPGVSLSLRHEVWGEAALARGAVRRVVSAGARVALPLGAELRVAHAVYRTRRGESFYLPERERDRLVLRALAGAGQRTRAELALPAAGGTVRSSLGLTTGRTRAGRAQWSVDWTRRLRLRRGG